MDIPQESQKGIIDFLMDNAPESITNRAKFWRDNN
jgi:hypothetical protein